MFQVKPGLVDGVGAAEYVLHPDHDEMRKHNERHLETLHRLRNMDPKNMQSYELQG